MKILPLQKWLKVIQEGEISMGCKSHWLIALWQKKHIYNYYIFDICNYIFWFTFSGAIAFLGEGSKTPVTEIVCEGGGSTPPFR